MKMTQENVSKSDTSQVKHLEALINSCEDMIWSVDNEFKLITANKAFIQSMDNLVGMKFKTGDDLLMKGVFPDELLEDWESSYRKALSANSYTKEFFVPAIAGRESMWTETRFSPIYQDNTICGVTCYTRNITEEKIAEHKIKESEDKYRSLIHSSIDGILLTVKDGSILSANTAACEMFKTSEEELCQLGRGGVVDITDPRLELFLVERNMTGRAKGELTLKRTDGTTFPGEVSSVVFIDAYGRERTAMTIRDLTQIKQAEENLISSSHELKQTLDRYNRIMDSSLDVICAVDEEGLFVSVSAASEKVWGYKPHELIGRPVFDFVYHEDYEETRKVAANVIAGNNNTHFENRFVHKNGSLVPTAWTATWNPNDKMRYSVARDVTEKRRAEKIIEIERQRFSELYLQAPFCMGILKGRDHVYEIANPLYLQLIGKKDIIGKTVKEVLPELEAQGVFEFLDSVYNTGKTFSANEMLVQFDYNANGVLVDKYLNFIYQAHKNNEGEIDGILFFAVDVTEQVISRKKIEESEFSYKSLIDQATDAICIADSSLKFIEVNPYACQLFGYTREEALKLSVMDVVFEEDLISNPFKTWAVEVGVSVKNERRVKTKDGTALDMDLSTRLTKDGKIVMFGHDITERKKAERQISYSEQRYRTLFEQNLAGFYQSTVDGKIINCNDAFAKMLKYNSSEELLSLNTLELYFSSGDRESFIKNIIEHKAIYNSEGILRCKDGSALHYMENITVHIDGINGIDYFDGIVIDITERKQAELQLKESHAKYKAIIDNTINSFLLSDIEGNILEVNETACKTLGYTEAELLKLSRKDVFDLDAPEYVKAVETRKARGTASGEVYGIKKSGERVPISFTTSLFYTAEGEERLSSIGVDITEKKTAELALAESENYLRAIIQAEPECVKLLDKDGLLLDMNPAGLAMIEADNLSQVKGSTVLNIVNEPYREAFDRLTQDGFNGFPGTLEFEITGLKGTNRWLETNSVPLRNGEGEILSLLSVTRDVTDRKKSEEKILKSHERFSNVSKATFDVVWDWDINTRQLYLGDAFKELFGYEINENENFYAWSTHIHPDDRERVITNRLNKIINQDESSWKDAYRYIKSDGSIAYISDRGILLRNDLGTYRMIGAMQDVTELEENEKAIIELNKNLKKRAEELASSNEELERFAYVTSHDLQEPLRMVTSFLQLLQKKYDNQLDDTAQKYINFAVDGADRMKILILDLLEFSRISSVVVEHNIINLNEVVAKTKQALKAVIDESGATIKVDHLPAICGNEFQLLQLFQNLISNAIKYKGNKKPIVQIGFIENENEWQFSIKDNGIGINEKYFEKIFIIFQRLHNRKEYDGTGIGLAICKKIVELHGGRIWVESSTEGSQFYFTIIKKQISDVHSKIISPDLVTPLTNLT